VIVRKDHPRHRLNPLLSCAAVPFLMLSCTSRGGATNAGLRRRSRGWPGPAHEPPIRQLDGADRRRRQIRGQDIHASQSDSLLLAALIRRRGRRQISVSK
jgi:hypothetical protein